MALASSLIREDNFLCSICLDVFTKPVTIPCGHNFCLGCITSHWDASNTLSNCPLCKEVYYTGPMLRVNTFIAEMATKFKETVQKKPCGKPDLTGNVNVLCDICTGAKCTALKSCLVCVMSYCEAHLEPHQRISALKKHKLINPVENLESRMCNKHDECLELFCRVDRLFLCKSCTDSDHKTHKSVSLEEEAQNTNIQLEKEKRDMNHMIQTRQKKISELQHSLEVSRYNATEALSQSMHVMTSVMDFIKRSQAELTNVVQRKQEKLEAETTGFIKELEEEIMQIKQNNLQLNQLSLGNDAFVFLENFLSLTNTQLQLKDWSGLTLNSDYFTIQRALAKLETTVTREIRMLCDPDLKAMQQYAVDVALDPDTANPSLNISEDRKQVTHGDKKRKLPNKPQRFDHVLNVLAKEGFSSGKFYYEVQVKDKTNWDLGVVNQSINRKGDIRLSPKTGYWTIWLRKGNEFTANAGPAINLDVREVPQKVGVFVDYEEGRVSFYDVDNRARIFCFTKCNFTEELFLFFSPCSNDDGKNSAPLIITPVKQNN